MAPHKCELKVNFNNETLPFCSKPKYLGVTLDRCSHFKCSSKCTLSFLLYAHVRITIMLDSQKVMHAKIAHGL